MPSPFPGMDPFIELSMWQTFHAQFVPALGALLVPQIRPAYIVNVQQDVYLVRDDRREGKYGPDVAVVKDPAGGRSRVAGKTGGAAVALRPVVRSIPMPYPRRQNYLTIQNRDSNEVVTVVELLSPTNKGDHSGREAYLEKREKLLESGVSLVEIDLLRGGPRMPVSPQLPEGDYFAVVCRGDDVPRAEVYAWRLRDPLPKIPVPLGRGEADAVLDLKRAFRETYDRAGFDYALRYGAELDPPVEAPEMKWVDRKLTAAKVRRKT